MDEDKAPTPVHGGGGGLPPHSSHFSASFAAFSSNFPASGDPLPSSFSLPNEDDIVDISLMPDFLPRNSDHRRAHSDILGVPDDIGFYSDLGVVGLQDDIDEELLSAYFDIEKFNSSPRSSSGLSGGAPSGSVAAPPAPSQTEKPVSASNERPGAGHQHSQSMDGSASVLLGSSAEGPGPTLAEMKKATEDEKLADLALVDPKRAKRFR